MLLNEADKVYFGTAEAARVYLGATLVWEPEAVGGDWGPEESLYPATAATQGDAPSILSLGSRIGILADGRITHIRYWKPALSSRTVAIWSDAGALLFSKVSTGVAGWNSEPVDPPLLVSAGQTIRVAYGYAGSGTDGQFGFSTSAAVYADTVNLDFISGCYHAGGSADFPDTIPGDASNYYVDVVYQENVAATAPTAPDEWLTTAFNPTDYQNGDGATQVGARIVLTADREVTWIGMRYNGGATRTGYVVKLYDWVTDTVLRTGTIDLTGKALGEYGWVAIEPITLAAGVNGYGLLMDIAGSDGRLWANETPVTVISGVSFRSAYRYLGTLTGASLGYQYGGVDLGWNT